MQYAYGTYITGSDENSRVTIDPHSPGIQIVNNQTKTASFTQSDSITMENANALLVVVQITALTGTSPSLTCSLQWSQNNSSFTTANQASLIPQTAAGTYSFIAFNGPWPYPGLPDAQDLSPMPSVPPSQYPYGRVTFTIAGTTPSVTFSCWVKPFYIGTGA